MNVELNLVCELSPVQKKKFNSLKKAYAACKKAGIRFDNVYGNLYGVPSEMVADYGDSSMLPTGELAIQLNGSYPSGNRIEIPNEWTDDNHIMGLTAKGAKAYQQLLKLQ